MGGVRDCVTKMGMTVVVMGHCDADSDVLTWRYRRQGLISAADQHRRRHTPSTNTNHRYNPPQCAGVMTSHSPDDSPWCVASKFNTGTATGHENGSLFGMYGAVLSMGT